MLVQFSRFSQGDAAVSKAMLKYIGTRDGVAIDENDKRESSTKQVKLINDIINTYSDFKQLPEYLTYEKYPTLRNASIFITESMNIQANSGKDNDKIYLKYISERPGVIKDKMNSHGLFNSTGTPNIEDELEKLNKSEKSTVWTHILSLTRDEAIKYEMNTKEDWESLLKEKIYSMAKNFNISVSNLEWNAAFHDEAHHPHIHLQMYSTDENEGKLSKEKTKVALEKNRKILSDSIYHHEKNIIVEEYENINTEIKEEIVKLLSPENSIKLLNDFQLDIYNSIKDDLQNHKGKNVYGFLSPTTKANINELLKSLLDYQISEQFDDLKRNTRKYLELYSSNIYKNELRLNDQLEKMLNPTKKDKTTFQNLIVKSILKKETGYQIARETEKSLESKELSFKKEDSNLNQDLINTQKHKIITEIHSLLLGKGKTALLDENQLEIANKIKKDLYNFSGVKKYGFLPGETKRDLSNLYKNLTSNYINDINQIFTESNISFNEVNDVLDNNQLLNTMCDPSKEINKLNMNLILNYIMDTDFDILLDDKEKEIESYLDNTDSLYIDGFDKNNSNIQLNGNNECYHFFYAYYTEFYTNYYNEFYPKFYDGIYSYLYDKANHLLDESDRQEYFNHVYKETSGMSFSAAAKKCSYSEDTFLKFYKEDLSGTSIREKVKAEVKESIMNSIKEDYKIQAKESYSSQYEKSIGINNLLVKLFTNTTNENESMYLKSQTSRIQQRNIKIAEYKSKGVEI